MKFSRCSTLLVLVLFNPVIFAADPEISIRDGYVRGLPPGVSNTAAYMIIENHSTRALTLTGARATVGDSVSLHETRMQNGQMSMVPVTSIVIQADGELVLESGAMHFMLTGMHEPLAESEEVEMTLLFEGGQEFQFSLPVRSVLSESSHTGH